MNQVLGAFELLDSPCYGPFSLGGHFETDEPFISLLFKFFFLAAVNSGYLKPKISNQCIQGHDCIYK
jgi:hypothetical protein